MSAWQLYDILFAYMQHMQHILLEYSTLDSVH